MADTRKVLQKGATVAGGVLSVVVVGLLAFLYSPKGQGRVEIPVVHAPLPAGHTVYVCRGSPKAVFENLDRATAFAKAHGTVYGLVTTAECSTLCNANGRMIPCHAGGVTVSLRDGEFGDDHCGETISGIDAKNQIVWATVLMPEKCYAPDGGPMLPKDGYAIALTHELAGHAEGRGHTKTQIVKGIVAEKSGEVMNASLLKGGWGDAGW